MIPVIAPLTQLVEGIHITDDLSTTCDSCQRRLEEGQRVRCRIESRSILDEWTASTLHCTDCKGQLYLDTPGSALVTGRLGSVRDTATQSSWLVLLDPESICLHPLG